MQAAETLQEICEDVGIPDNLKSDRAPYSYVRESSYIKLAKYKRVILTYAEPERSNEIYNVELQLEISRSAGITRWCQRISLGGYVTFVSNILKKSYI